MMAEKESASRAASFDGGLAEGAVVEGRVEHGRRLGRRLGFPTANLPLPEGFPVPNGVYASRAEVGGRCYDAVSNLGCNPSVGGAERHLETHLLDFSGDLYGSTVRVVLLDRIRDEKRFGSVEELREQIARDRECVRRLFAAR